MKRKCNKYDFMSAFITVVNVIIGIVMYFVLDSEIAIQWRGTVPTSIVSKNYIFLFPLIAVVFFFGGKSILQYVSYKWFKNAKQVLIDYLNMFLQIIFITCQLYIVLYSLGLRVTVAGILIIEIVIGIFFGMKLKKR